MAFTCNLYKISDPPFQLDKNLGNALRKNIRCSPFEPMGDLKGNIIIDYSFNADEANYCSITETSGGETPVTRTRYAFITDRVKGVGGRLTLVLEEDPLMTYYTDILKQTIEVTRCSKQANEASKSGYNSMLRDPEIETTVQRSYREFAFKIGPPELNTDMKFVYPTNQYILAVIG